MMILAGHSLPAPSELDELEMRRHRLAELLDLGLVSNTLSLQIARSIAALDWEIAAVRQKAMAASPMRLAA